MPAEDDVDPGVHRRKLRSILRHEREICGKTQTATAEAMSWSVSKLIRIESGSVSISVNDLRALLRYYDVTEEERVESLVMLARLARRHSWLNAYKDVASMEYLAYLGYEELAVRSYNFQPVLVPGLLQTEEYAAAIIHTIRGPKIPSRIEKLVELRIARQEKVFARTNRFDLYFLLDESVVRRPVGGLDIMRKQLQWLLEINERDNVTIGIIPFKAGFYRSIRYPSWFSNSRSPKTRRSSISVPAEGGDYKGRYPARRRRHRIRSDRSADLPGDIRGTSAVHNAGGQHADPPQRARGPGRLTIAA